jgi:hypothetical protein
MLPALALLLALPLRAENIPLNAQLRKDFSTLRDRGCIREQDFLYTVNVIVQRSGGDGNRVAWDTSNAGTGVVLRYTVGSFQELMTSLYQAPTLLTEGEAFEAIARRCRGASDPRRLAQALQMETHAYMEAHDLAPSRLFGGRGAMCKLYSAYALGAAKRIPSIVENEALVSGWGHVINRVGIRDGSGRIHRFLLDSLNEPLFAKLAEPDGSCLPDAAPAPAAAQGGRRAAIGRSPTLEALSKD